jgi:hypothetical protein
MDYLDLNFYNRFTFRGHRTNGGEFTPYSWWSKTTWFWNWVLVGYVCGRVDAGEGSEVVNEMSLVKIAACCR